MSIVAHIEALYARLDAALDRVASLETLVERMHRYGPVTDVNTENQTARIRIGGTDDAPVKSPWISYAQSGGAFSVHNPPSIGQQMMMIAPHGVWEQAMLLPYTFSSANPSPSKKPNEHVLKFGSMSFNLQTQQLATLGIIKVGGDGNLPRVLTEAGPTNLLLAKV